MPANASFTRLNKARRSRQTERQPGAVFGDYISIYDIPARRGDRRHRARSTREPHLQALPERAGAGVLPGLNAGIQMESTEGEEQQQGKLKPWAASTALVGGSPALAWWPADTLVPHVEKTPGGEWMARRWSSA